MKLDLRDFAFKLSKGEYQGLTLGDALAKEFAMQCLAEFNAIELTKRNKIAFENAIRSTPK